MEEHPAGSGTPGLNADPAQAERLVQQANLAKVRGDNVLAGRLLEEALSLAPESPAVLAAVGQDQLERKQYKKATESLRAALSLDPENASIERLYGEAVLHSSMASNPDAMLAGLAPDENWASGSAAVLSIFLPGLGQFVAGERPKALGMFFMWSAGVVWLALIPGGLSNLRGLMRPSATTQTGEAIMAAAICVLAWLWSVADAQASVRRRPKLVIQRPTPPVDKEF